MSTGSGEETAANTREDGLTSEGQDSGGGGEGDSGGGSVRPMDSDGASGGTNVETGAGLADKNSESSSETQRSTESVDDNVRFPRRQRSSRRLYRRSGADESSGEEHTNQAARGSSSESEFPHQWEEFLLSSSSSESSRSSHSYDNDLRTRTVEEDEPTPKVLLKPKPTHKWFAVKEIVNRAENIGSRHALVKYSEPIISALGTQRVKFFHDLYVKSDDPPLYLLSRWSSVAFKIQTSRSTCGVPVQESGQIVGNREIGAELKMRLDKVVNGEWLLSQTALALTILSEAKVHYLHYHYVLFVCYRCSETGCGGRWQGPERFQHRYYGSLHAVQRLELMYKLDEHYGCVNSLHFNRSGELLVSASDDKRVVLWDWAADRSILSYDSGHSGNVFQAKFLPLSGDRHIVTCARDGQVRLSVLSGVGVCKGTRLLAQHRRTTHKLATHHDTPHVFLSAGEDALVLSHDVRTNKASKLLFVKEGANKMGLYSIHSNPVCSNEFIVTGEDQYIRLYDKRNISDGRPLSKFCPTHLLKPDVFLHVTCAVFNYNGTEVIGSYNDDDIYLFDTRLPSEADYVHKYEGHRNSMTVKGVNFFGPRSEFIVSGSDCGNIFFWDKNTESIVQWMRGDEEGVSQKVSATNSEAPYMPPAVIPIPVREALWC
ncbi:DDB1- and CUL4-associated factor 8 [Homalodisca vitripennis]|nr:DDB1- and CUL4-associated factor 8 [Homalodisca vitripennis]